MTTSEEKYAAVSLVERADGRILCVWNQRYGGWSLPGGMMEPGETAEQAQCRELEEETGLCTTGRCVLYHGPHGMPYKPGRASAVIVYRVWAHGQPREREPGCPVTWLRREEFVTQSPFGQLYKQIFGAWPHQPTWSVGGQII